MNTDSLVRLAACATKINEEAKQTEARARACKVYARKVSKDSKEASKIAHDLLKLSKQTLQQLLTDFYDDSDVTDEVLESFLKSVPNNHGICDVTMLRAIHEFDPEFPMLSDVPALNLTPEQIEVVEQSILDQTRHDHDVTGSYVTQQSGFHRDEQIPSQNVLGAIPTALLNNQQGVFGVATKRRSRRKTKARAMGIPSPLLSGDEVTITKRTTSPNPSQHSGVSPFVGTQHKFSVRRNRSVSSQQTLTDDEDRSQSPLAVTSQSPNVTSPLTIDNDSESN